MIPAAFEYHRPKDMAGVLSILEEHGNIDYLTEAG